MRVKKQFNKYAKEYEKYSIIQQSGVEELIKILPSNIGRVLDLGCGSGRVYKELIKNNIEFKEFVGVDFSPKMLELHPKAKGVVLMEGDFNNKELFESFKRFDYIISASSLQWAKDIDFTFEEISKKSDNVAFFIFCSNTFKTIHQIANISSPIYSKNKIISSFEKFFNIEIIKELDYKLEFENTLNMLRYIKQSGVSGGGMGLSIKEIKKIINSYPYNYLEFETILLKGKSR